MADYEILDLLGVSTKEPAEPSGTTKKKPGSKEPAPKKKASTPAEKTDIFLPQKRETRSRRVQLLMKPSLYDLVKETADEYGTNVNELISTILENVLTK